MKILLTGGSGFIGSAFLRLAIERGHEVAVLELPETAPRGNLKDAARITWLEGALEAPPFAGIAAFAPEVCVHAAWVTAPKVAYDSPEHFRCFEWSRDFFQRLCDGSLRQIVSVGTCIEFELGKQLLVEDRTPIKPIGPYPAAKNELRVFLEKLSANRGFSLCWPRVFYVYGVGEHPSRLCSSIIQKLRAGEKIVLKTPASTKDYIYVTDVASALLTVVEKRFAGAVNVCTGTGVTILELAQTLARLLGRPELVEAPASRAEDPLGYVVGDPSRMHALGWSPQFDLRRGLETMVAAIA